MDKKKKKRECIPHFFYLLSIFSFAWPIYWIGQVFLTVGALSSFSDMELHPVPTKSSSSADTIINVAAIAGFLVAMRRLLGH